MKKGTKRLLVIFMLMASPLVFAEPISPLQGLHIKAPKPLLIETSPAVKKTVLPKVKKLKGTASWYSETDPFINKHTANGEVFDDTQMTCASWHYPFQTLLQVTNLQNGKTIVCRVNDRGPAKRLNRVIDLSKAAFLKIADTRRGLVKVTVRPIGRAK